jgi:hypothetical protein
LYNIVSLYITQCITNYFYFSVYLQLIKMLLDLVACLAWQDVSADDRTSTVQCARLLSTAVDGVLANYHVKVSPCLCVCVQL